MAARPKTLPAAIVPVWCGSVLAWKLTGEWSAWLAFCTVAGAVCIQIATNFFNDAIDADKGADTKARLGPTRVTASGLLSRRAVYGIAMVFLLLALICGVVLFRAAGWPILWIGLPSLYLAYGYTGGPFPLAYRGMGELFVVAFFGVIAVSGTVYVQTLQWREEALLLGFQVGLLSAVLISINNLRDRSEDATTGKNTLAVRLGELPARLVIWVEIKMAAICGIFWFKHGLPNFAAVSLPIWLLGGYLSWRCFREPIGVGLNKWLAVGGILLVLFAIVFQVAALF